VLNKADREGARRAAQELSAVLGLKQHTAGSWMPPVLLTVARDGEGVAELADGLERHLAHLRARDLLAARRRRRLVARVGELVRARAGARLRQRVDDGRWDSILAALEERRLSPHQAAAMLWHEAWPEDGGRTT
jgi:LAO/AO transport system kinase